MTDRERRPPQPGQPPVEIVRSRRRRKTASASIREGRVVVRLPAGLAAEEEDRLIASLVRRVVRTTTVQDAGGDEALAARAAELAETYLDGVLPTSVTWSKRMRRRWGSCTPAQGTIRISDAVAGFPDWVRDYVLVHELAHLQVGGHTPAFWELVDRYPDSVRAQGFLAGVEHAGARLSIPDDPLRRNQQV